MRVTLELTQCQVDALATVLYGLRTESCIEEAVLGYFVPETQYDAGVALDSLADAVGQLASFNQLPQ